MKGIGSAYSEFFVWFLFLSVFFDVFVEFTAEAGAAVVAGGSGSATVG
jgi:hypothetical protein